MSSRPPRRPTPPARGATPVRRPAAQPAAATASPAAAADPLVGREIAGHQILQRVATGRLCSTYKATHLAMNRTVAFKALSRDADENTVERFQATARQAAQVHHPNIASIYDVNSDGSVQFCTMEFVEGQSLGDLLRAHQKIPSADAVRVAIDVAEALRYANQRRVPGWRLSANRVVISTRGEVKLLPPSFVPGTAPVLDDGYVVTAVGVLLYAMLSGGKVRDLEYALEPGSSAPAHLERLRNVAPGIRRDIAQVTERLLGIAGERFPSADAALHALRALLAVQEQAETRARRLSDSARARVQRTRHGIIIAIAAVAVLAIALLAVFVLRSGTAARAEETYAEAVREADAAIAAFKDAQGRFHAAPSDALAQQAIGHLERARAAFARVASAYPDHVKGQAAAASARNLEDEIRKFQDVAQAAGRYAAALARIREVDKELDKEVASRLERGGQLDLAAWRKRYADLARDFADNPRAADALRIKLTNLPQQLLAEQVRIDANAVSNEVLKNCLPNLQYGKALEAWNEYRRKYGRLDSDALRRRVVELHDKASTEIRQAARVKYGALSQQAQYHAQKGEHDKAREIYNRVIESFGILEYIDRAKEALAKLPKS